MTAYKIMWEIEANADTPEAAAFEAQRTQRDPASIANVFYVADDTTAYCIDLDELPSRIDLSDMPEATRAWFERARLVLPPTTGSEMSGHLFFCPECRGKRYISDGQGNWARCEACYLLGPPPPPPPGDKPLLRVEITTDPEQIAPLTQAMRDALLRHEVMHLIHTLSEKLAVSEPTKSEMLAGIGRETGVPVMEFTMTEADPSDMRGFATPDHPVPLDAALASEKLDIDVPVATWEVTWRNAAGDDRWDRTQPVAFDVAVRFAIENQPAGHRLVRIDRVPS